MKTRALTIVLFVLSLVAVSAGFIVLHLNGVQYFCPWQHGSEGFSCGTIWTEVAKALEYGMTTLASVFLLLLFVPRAFSAWWKLSIWYIPLSIYLYATVAINSMTPHIINLTPSPEPYYLLINGIYIVLILALILMVSLKKKALK